MPAVDRRSDRDGLGILAVRGAGDTEVRVAVGNTALQSGDVIRIGQVTLYLSQQVEEARPQRSGSGTHRFTRELVLEALDQHAILLYDTARRLNTVTDRALRIMARAISAGLPASKMPSVTTAGAVVRSICRDTMV